MRHPFSTGWPAMAHDLHFPPHLLFEPLSSFACVSLIHPHFFHAGEEPFDWLQKQRHTLPVLDIGFMHNHFEHESGGIDKKMPFPA